MSTALEDKDSPALKARLQALGFEQVQFEPKVNNRFIVQMEGLPSYVVRGIQFPDFIGTKWEGLLQLECYNPLATKLEEAALALVSKEEVNVIIKILSPTAEVDTTWEIVATNGVVEFGGYNWGDEGKPNMLTLLFSVKTAKVTY